MLPTLSIGPLVIPTASLVTILGIWASLAAIEKAAEILDLNVPWIYSLATIAMGSGFVAARTVFVAAHWSAYSENLVGIVWPLTSGYNLWAGILVGLAAAFFYGRARQLHAGDTLDALAPGMLVAAISISLADFLAGPGYGTEAQLPWSISLFGISRHPVQLYEILVAALSLLLWFAFLRRRAFGGHLFLLTAVVFSMGRLFIDAYRANTILTAGGYHVVQIASLFVAIVAMIMLMLRSTDLRTEGDSYPYQD